MEIKNKTDMNTNLSVTVISTLAEDVLIRDHGIERIEGAPALYITNFLKNKDIDYKLITGQKAIVEIDMRNNVELGKINPVEMININKNISLDCVLVSTLLDEVKLRNFGEFSCLDLQGYVRDGSKFGGKKEFSSDALKYFKIIKGTKEEVSYVPEKILRNIPILLITDGSNGFDIMENNKSYKFNVEKINAKNTIGAGDTFFAAFCTKYYLTKDIQISSNYAKNSVYDFLKSKN